MVGRQCVQEERGGLLLSGAVLEAEKITASQGTTSGNHLACQEKIP